jgi:hypothetical protein
MMDYIAEKLGVPARVRTTPEERAVAQEQAMQAAQQMAQQAPEAIPAMADAVMKGCNGWMGRFRTSITFRKR